MKKILLASVALVLAACGGSASYEGTYSCQREREWKDTTIPSKRRWFYCFLGRG